MDDKQLTNRNVELFPFIKEDKKQQTLVKVKKNNNTYPLMVKRNNHFYLATTNLFSPVSHFLADALHFYFSVEHDHVNKAMLRLEDIHPKLIGEDLMEIATYLKNKDIPYLVSVIPVYKNPKTKEEFHLSDNSKLVDVLQFMQNNGGSFVLHGYTDQYGNNPTGDGFEFWDKQHNQPIYFPPNQLEIIKSEKDFADSTEYKKYLEDKKKFETEYIKERIKKGMAELEKVQLYPIAFEAPHYAMSQNGYQVISDYFPFYIGQVQLSDQDWRVMTESPTISNPNFLNGMTLFPETVRYIEYNEPNSLAQIREHITETSIVRDGVISGFYHPFLGKDQLTELVSEFEKQSHIEWIDLQEIYNDAFPNKIKFQQSSDNDKKKAH
ncbi:hypothetical protein JCM21714_3740 [Gracilibacillus boraciitolerans JCM 21714]|uniref:DUF2334 domain-containing protein n=1 Tax=Gracilibacillus boraciitolerans JCM 21714 TaxID=1298598 RepID=W4VMF1_9BACI|nr:polysaccharide deacetylase family protein [Gracilibacillus boraciitolerans]GAE94570.1 hypothetical protein JCM21714_3740 [Gracilibacillus boraciitolerans JCM 21714]